MVTSKLSHPGSVQVYMGGNSSSSSDWSSLSFSWSSPALSLQDHHNPHLMHPLALPHGLITENITLEKLCDILLSLLSLVNTCWVLAIFFILLRTTLQLTAHMPRSPSLEFTLIKLVLAVLKRYSTRN